MSGKHNTKTLVDSTGLSPWGRQKARQVVALTLTEADLREPEKDDPPLPSPADATVVPVQEVMAKPPQFELCVLTACVLDSAGFPTELDWIMPIGPFSHVEWLNEEIVKYFRRVGKEQAEKQRFALYKRPAGEERPLWLCEKVECYPYRLARKDPKNPETPGVYVRGNHGLDVWYFPDLSQVLLSWDKFDWKNVSATTAKNLEQLEALERIYPEVKKFPTGFYAFVSAGGIRFPFVIL